MNTAILEYAIRNKLRFPFKGMISIEDLWDLSLESLDSIYKTLNAQKKETQEESLLQTETKENKELTTKIEIVKHIVTTKQEEIDARKQLVAKAAEKQRIMELIDRKKNEELSGKSLEELEELLKKI